MMTNGEHDSLWIGGAKALPGINNTLRTANAIACIKELYALGELSKEDYIKSLLNCMRDSGYGEVK